MLIKIFFLLPTLLLFIILTLSLLFRFRIFFKKYCIYILFPLVIINTIFFALLLPYFSPIDEGGHFAYVEHLAVEKTLPLLSDYVSKNNLALLEHTYPNPSSLEASKIGFGGQIYESFQPPLYYLAGSIVYSLTNNNAELSVYALRLLNTIIFSITIFIWYKALFYIEKNIFANKDTILPFLSFIFALIPGLAVRMVCVSNAVLELLFSTLLIFFLIRFLYVDLKNKHLIILGTLLGLLLLTRFSSFFLILIVIAYLIYKRKRIFKNLLVVGLLTTILLLPWFAFNYKNYGSLTSNKNAKEIQAYIVNPGHENYGMSYLASKTFILFDTFWSPDDVPQNVVKFVYYSQIITFLGFITPLIILFSIFYLILSYREFKKSSFLQVWCLAILVIFLNIIQLYSIVLIEDWPVLGGRYLSPSILAFIIMFGFVFNSFVLKRFINIFYYILSLFILFIFSFYLFCL
ncbi:MAG: hypothetical protein PHN19_00825 [Patescibacteria group bacterium]|nr:hypothetical protein [Patescibacteria group bacterium]